MCDFFSATAKSGQKSYRVNPASNKSIFFCGVWSNMYRKIWASGRWKKKKNLSHFLTNVQGYANHLFAYEEAWQKACEGPHSRCRLFVTFPLHHVIEPTVIVTYITESPSLSPSSHSPSCMSALLWVIESLKLTHWRRSSMQRVCFHSEVQSQWMILSNVFLEFAYIGASWEVPQVNPAVDEIKLNLEEWIFHRA